MGQLPNPNWPLTAVELDATAGPPNVPGASRVSLESRGMAVTDVSSTRGLQYELAHAEAGTLTATVSDPNEILNPGNSASPLNTGGNSILPYRAMRFSAMWNAATMNQSGNILNSANQAPGQPDIGSAYGYDPSFETWNVVGNGNWIIAADGTTFTGNVVTLPSGPLNSNVGFETAIAPWAVTGGAVAQSTTQKHSGTYSAQITPPGAAAQVYIESEKVSVTQGNLYCVNLWVWATNAVTSNFSASVNWFNAANAYLSTSSLNVSVTAGTWTNVQNTFTAPVGAATGTVVPTLSGTPAAAQIIYVDDASLTNATNPADGSSSYAVTKGSMAASNSYIAWIPRVIGGGTYTLSVDVYAPTGVTARVNYGSYAASSTVTGAWQTLSMTVTAGNGFSWQLFASAAPAYPATIYFANWRIVGLSPGWSQTAGSAMAYTQAQAHSGQYSLSTVMQASTDSMSLPLPTVPGIVYTMSSWVLPSGSAVQMYAGGTNATSTTANTWQRLTTTFTATDAVTSVAWNIPSGTYPATFWFDDIQLECAQTASTYSASGPKIYNLYTGYVERYPSTWVDAGFRAIRPLVAVDALSILSRTMISQSYLATALADGPNVIIPYGDSYAPHRVMSPRGGLTLRGTYKTGTNTTGQGSVNYGGDRFLDGTAALSIVQQNKSSVYATDPTLITNVGTADSVVLLDPQSATLEMWVKIPAGSVYFGAADVTAGEDPATQNFVAYYAGWYTTSTGQLEMKYSDPNNGISTFALLSDGKGYTGFPDGQWHHLSLIFLGGNVVKSMVDMVDTGVTAMASVPSVAVPVNNFFVTATGQFTDPLSSISVANTALYPTALTTAQLSNHYQRGVGYIGELLGARASRILAQYWGGSSTYNTAPGRVGLAPDYAYNGRSVLDVMTEAADTEGGRVYADVNGVVQVEDRASRYSSQSPVVVFGEKTSAGEIPYESVEYDYDPTYVFSQVNLSRPGNSNYPPQVNSTSQANFGNRILSQSLQVNNDFDLSQAANFYLARYGTPKQRIRRLVINPATYPKAWGAVLPLEIGQEVTVNRRTSAGVTMSATYYVEQIRHSVSATSHTWRVELQLSPVWVPRAFVLNDSSYGVLGVTAGNAVIY